MKKPVIYKLGEEKFEIHGKITAEDIRSIINKLTDLLYVAIHEATFLLSIERAKNIKKDKLTK